MSNFAGQHPVAPITAVAHGGHGLCRIEGQVCFVPFALPGDTVRVVIERQARGVLWGAIEAIIEPSPDRRDVAPDHFGACGGCMWLHFAYPAQAEWKQRFVRDSLARIARIEAEIEWVERPEWRLGYRTRAEFHGRGGRLGFYAPGSHEVSAAGPCPLLHPRLVAALERLCGLGLDGPIDVVVNPDGSETLVWTRRPAPALRKHFPATAWPRHRSPRPAFSFDGVPVVCGIFSQSSLLLNRMLVEQVHGLLAGAGRVLDLYCGSGNLSVALPPDVAVLGLDHNEPGVRAAATLRPGQYRVGSEAEFAAALAKPWDAVLLNPPRTGARAIMPALAHSTTGKIVYVACDPATLARDLKMLGEGGWRLDRAIAVDLFPHTPHVETVCLLTRP